jgi:hypothetical protein
MVLSKEGAMRVLVLFFFKQHRCTRSIPEIVTKNSACCVQNARQPKLLHRLPGQQHLRQQPKRLHRLKPRRFPLRLRGVVEIQQTVDLYLADNSSTTDVAQTFGYPIRTWCFELTVTDVPFSFLLFETLRLDSLTKS